ncbi:DUF262 domain-containing protein [Saccharopolyspora gloriosae]|uniref:GmrSD restriction endonuclease domain-containing protein n=1 Tax=Saccharopolyspora gloriosae TaxID=455344 RepID=UPI001FB73A91|nr:DUF262 domain-containing protein [Saccharopolyspora gloriosae]
METLVRTPQDIFYLPQHLVVPLFQRPYVWTEENQWEPLWQDLRRLAELRLDNPNSAATHFLGAVVLQAQENLTGTLQPRLVIDGQQRLTTLQLLMDATAAVLESRSQDNLARRLEALTHNPDYQIELDDDVLKLRHTNRDKAGYNEVMRADPPIVYADLKHAHSLLALGHKFFGERVEQWLGDAEETKFATRAQALTNVITQSLQLVVIDLRSDENSQEIFETLNARGTPLTAADLIKNFVFQRLTAEGVDTHKAYVEDWIFESSFWEKEVGVGRYFISRSSLFLNQWLTSRVGEEISPKQTFGRFKHFVEHETSLTMAELLPVLKQQAGLYRRWIDRANDSHANLDAVELSVYRLQAMELEILKPLLIWLHEPEAVYDKKVIERVVRAAESWIVRRALLRLSTPALGRVVADLVATHRNTPQAELVTRVETYLSRLNVASTYWPGDAEIKSSLATEAAYKRFKRARLRVFLEAAEDHLRGYTGSSPLAGGRVDRGRFPIEHVMPQAWETHWSVGDLAAEIDRRDHIHRLGNLTLLTEGLNSKVSNGPWLGEEGKRATVRKHDVFLLNKRIEDMSDDGWDETRIDQRTAALIDGLLTTWPVPEGHLGEIKDAPAAAVTYVSLQQLIAAGHLQPGTILRSRPGNWGEHEAVVLDGGDVKLDGQTFNTPSAAGHHVRKGATNGWHFWLLPDGRRLADVRDTYRRDTATSK